MCIRDSAWTAYQDFGHSHWHNSLIWGENIENVSIIGPGLINGKGLSWGLETRLYKDPPPNAGNKAIGLKNCHNVILRDISILHGGHFAILATGVDNLTIDNVRLDTNRDGMDIDCCHNVRISNCSVNSPWDDGICLKSSYALGCLREMCIRDSSTPFLFSMRKGSQFRWRRRARTPFCPKVTAKRPLSSNEPENIISCIPMAGRRRPRRSMPSAITRWARSPMPAR